MTALHRFDPVAGARAAASPMRATAGRRGARTAASRCAAGRACIQRGEMARRRARAAAVTA
jgi:hypothetical protein